MATIAVCSTDIVTPAALADLDRAIELMAEEYQAALALRFVLRTPGIPVQVALEIMPRLADVDNRYTQPLLRFIEKANAKASEFMAGAA